MSLPSGPWTPLRLPAHKETKDQAMVTSTFEPELPMLAMLGPLLHLGGQRLPSASSNLSLHLATKSTPYSIEQDPSLNQKAASS